MLNIVLLGFDLLNKSTLGRGIVLLGEHHHSGPCILKKRQISIPLLSFYLLIIFQ